MSDEADSNTSTTCFPRGVNRSVPWKICPFDHLLAPPFPPDRSGGNVHNGGLSEDRQVSRSESKTFAARGPQSVAEFDRGLERIGRQTMLQAPDQIVGGLQDCFFLARDTLLARNIVSE